MKPKHIVVGTNKTKQVTFGNDRPLAIMCGPCQIESYDHTMRMAAAVTGIAGQLEIPLVFKASFDKANRSSIGGARGIGMDKGLEILSKVKREFGVPVLSDVHETWQCAQVAETVDMLQIPAFLGRQTDLLLAAAKTGVPVHVKKGQAFGPKVMINAAKKVASTGNDKVLLCERGTMFGYEDLVVDNRALVIMARSGYPVVIDATHAVQQPGGQGNSSGGLREFVVTTAQSAIVNGVAGLFIETHDDPDNAPSDGPNAVPLDQLEPVLRQLKSLDEWAKAHPAPRL